MIAPMVLGLALFTQAGHLQQGEPMKQNRAPVQANPAPEDHPTSPDVDHLFGIAFLQSDRFETQAAALASNHGTADEVKGYAAKMMSEHSGMKESFDPVLHRLTASNDESHGGLAPADDLALKHLASLKPVDFDQEYIISQIGGHLTALAAFQAEADNGANAELKELARKWLPTIKAHLELAVDLSKHVAGSSPFKH